MHEDLAVQIHEDMQVEDADGDNVGTVRAVYQSVQRTTSGDLPASDAYIRVHVGLPILGKNLYIPTREIRDVTDDRVILRIDKSRVDEMGWDERPPWIHE